MEKLALVHHKRRFGSGSMKTVTLCAISAAFAACSTSLLCVLLLKDRSNNTVFGGCTQLMLEELNQKLDQPLVQFQHSVNGMNSLRSHLAEERHLDDARNAFPADKVRDAQISNQASQGLDFAIIGWPKTGTSFLMSLFAKHPEITMPEKEFCELPAVPDNLTRFIQETHDKVSLAKSTRQKTGIKCPTIIKDAYQIESLMKLSSDTRLIVGVRHPVLWFESFYNYRVKEVYDKNFPKSDIIPALHLNSQTHWKSCSVAFAKFDLFLKQLAKVSLTMDDTFEMGKTSHNPFWAKRVAVNPYKVFIYASEQLSDADTSRQDQFREDLEDYLGLDSPFLNFNEVGKVNSNKLIYPECIDICDPQYDKIRQTLLQIGKKSSKWIIRKFIKSKDVYVSNEEHFIKSVNSWGRDPCEVRNEDVRNVVSAYKGETERKVLVV